MDSRFFHNLMRIKLDLYTKDDECELRVWVKDQPALMNLQSNEGRTEELPKLADFMRSRNPPSAHVY